MRYIINIAILLTLPHLCAWAVVPDSLPKKQATDTVPHRKQSVSVGIEYGSDVSFFGRTNPSRYPFTTTDAIYNSKIGLFGYASAWKVLSSVPLIDEFDLGAGYSFKLSKNFKGALSYTRFLYSQEADIIKSSSTNDIDFKNTIDFKWFNTNISLDYLFGKSSDFFVTLNNSRYFESKWSVFDDKDYLTFTPSVNIIWGTQNFVEQYTIDHDVTNDHNNPKNGPGHYTPPTPPPNNTYTVNDTEFNMLSYGFKLPVGYNRPHYTVEASYRYAIPVNVQGNLLNTHESFFNLTFYYVFY